VAPVPLHELGRPANHARFLIDKLATQVRDLPEALAGCEEQERYPHNSPTARERQELCDFAFIKHVLAGK